MQKIDAHHHFWRYDAAEYGWITDEMAVLRRDFLPGDLQPLMAQTGITGVLTVQARQSLQENDWLLELARDTDYMLGIIGWVPLVDANVQTILDAYAEHSTFKAVRHVLLAESDDNYMLRDDFNRGIAVLTSLNLTYDILIVEKHLPQTITFVDRHPNQTFVVNHIARPRIREQIMSPWESLLKELGRREHVYCKMSGLPVEADWAHWTEDQLRPYMDVVLDAFGPQRVMFGSDWPECLVATDYVQSVEMMTTFLEHLSADEQQMIWSLAASQAYRLESSNQRA